MISRRGILGAFLAAPVIIRTPGLLMPIPRRLELSEWTGPVEPPNGTINFGPNRKFVYRNGVVYPQNINETWYKYESPNRWSECDSSLPAVAIVRPPRYRHKERSA